ncbi:hypothetical protein [Cellulomonas bogoriensis]
MQDREDREAGPGGAGGAVDPGRATAGRGGRRHRRATGGVQPPAADLDPRALTGPRAEETPREDDERLLREVPPHW